MSFAYKSSIESHLHSTRATRLARLPPSRRSGAFTARAFTSLPFFLRRRPCLRVTMPLQKHLTLIVAVALAIALLSREFGAPRDVVRRRARGWLKDFGR